MDQQEKAVYDSTNGRWFKVATAILGSVCAFLAVQVWLNSLAIARIQANRFTAQDGAELTERVEDKLDYIQGELVNLNRTLAGLPPSEWRARIRAIEHHLARVDGYSPPGDRD